MRRCCGEDSAEWAAATDWTREWEPREDAQEQRGVAGPDQSRARDQVGIRTRQPLQGRRTRSSGGAPIKQDEEMDSQPRYWVCNHGVKIALLLAQTSFVSVDLVQQVHAEGRARQALLWGIAVTASRRTGTRRAVGLRAEPWRRGETGETGVYQLRTCHGIGTYRSLLPGDYVGPPIIIAQPPCNGQRNICKRRPNF
jgi:hypothetical protein